MSQEHLFVTNESADRIVVRGRYIFDPGVETEVFVSGVMAAEIHRCEALTVRTVPDGETVAGRKS